jgi:hypothetical protein
MAVLTIQTATNMSRLRSAAADTNYNTSTACDVGNTTGGGTERPVGLFDFSALPAGAVITSAVLSLYVLEKSVPAPTSVIINRVVRADMVMSEVTWNSYKSASAWSTAGAANTTNDITATDAVTSGAIPAINNWLNITITALVQYAQANTSKILYLRGIGNVETVDYYVQFAGSAHATTGNRPKLTITYTLPSAPQIMIF